jgi:hypothetical protein
MGGSISNATCPEPQYLERFYKNILEHVNLNKDKKIIVVENSIPPLEAALNQMLSSKVVEISS